MHRTVQRIKSLGKRAGVAINPATPAGVLEEILPDLDQMLVMTANLGVWTPAFSSIDAAKNPAGVENDRADESPV